jgi:hypothetical protein
VVVKQAGVDTWSPAWYAAEDSSLDRAMRELATVPSTRGRMLPDKILGHRFGWMPASRLVWAEGHPSFDPDRLCSPDCLPESFERLKEAIGDRGFALPNGRTADIWTMPGSFRTDGFAGVRRLDSTVDLATDDSAEGLAILRGVAAIARHAPGIKGQVFYGLGGHVETIEWKGRGGRKTLGRWYDKGVELGATPRGRLIRPEDQRRFVKDQRRDVDELTTSYVRDKFQARFLPLWRATKGVTVAGPYKAGEKLLRLVDDGTLTPGQAEQLMGHFFLGELAEHSGTPWVSRATRYRRQAAMLDAGIVQSDVLDGELEVDLHDVLESVLDGASWGAG